MFHFGYGSNLSIDFVKEELIPDAKLVMKGYLPNFEVQFPFWSPERQAGYSGIMEAPGELVQGALASPRVSPARTGGPGCVDRSVGERTPTATR